MSLITRCPACGTMFKVVPDQLKISDGWVRCGHCSEVFDAAAHMQAETPPAPATLAMPDLTLDLPRDTYQDSEPPPAPAVVQPVADALPEPEREEPLAFEPEITAFDPVPAAPDAPETHDVSFVKDARRKAFWARPLVLAGLTLVVLVLLAGLLLQVAVQERDRLASLQPALKPWLQMLCEPVGCTVRAPRQIDALVIDSSTFSKLRGDAYRLAFTLKNQVPLDVATPSIELTLTDSQDQPVVRKVLSAAELGSANGVVAAASELQSSLAISVAVPTDGNRIAGYRLLAFYP